MRPLRQQHCDGAIIACMRAHKQFRATGSFGGNVALWVDVTDTAHLLPTDDHVIDSSSTSDSPGGAGGPPGAPGAVGRHCPWRRLALSSAADDTISHLSWSADGRWLAVVASHRARGGEAARLGSLGIWRVSLETEASSAEGSAALSCVWKRAGYFGDCEWLHDGSLLVTHAASYGGSQTVSVVPLDKLVRRDDATAAGQSRATSNAAEAAADKDKVLADSPTASVADVAAASLGVRDIASSTIMLPGVASCFAVRPSAADTIGTSTVGVCTRSSQDTPTTSAGPSTPESPYDGLNAASAAAAAAAVPAAAAGSPIARAATTRIVQMLECCDGKIAAGTPFIAAGSGAGRTCAWIGGGFMLPSDNGRHNVFSRDGEVLLTLSGPRGVINHVSPWGDAHVCYVNDVGVSAVALGGTEVKETGEAPTPAIRTIKLHSIACCGVDVSPDGTHVVAGDLGGQVCVWRIDRSGVGTAAKPIATCNVGMPIRSVTWQPTASTATIWFGDVDGCLWRWQPSVAALGGSPVGSSAPVAGDIEPRQVAVCEGSITCLAWEPAAQRAAVAEGSVAVTAASRADGAAPARTEGLGGTTPQCLMAATTTAGWILLYDVLSDAVVSRWHSPDATETNRVQWPVWSATWSPCGRFLASGSEDRSMSVWRRDGARVARLWGFDAAVTCVDWRHTLVGTTLAASSDDRTVRVYSAPLPPFRSETAVLDVPELRDVLVSNWGHLMITYCAVEPGEGGQGGGSRVVATTMGGQIYVWPLPADSTNAASAATLDGSPQERVPTSGEGCHWMHPHCGSVEGVRWTSSGLVVSASSDCTVLVHEPRAPAGAAVVAAASRYPHTDAPGAAAVAGRCTRSAAL